MISNRKPRVLVAAPTSFHKEYCQDDYLFLVNHLMYDNYEVLLVDNSPSKDNYIRLKSEGNINVAYINPQKNSSQKILAESHEYCREYALNNNFDYLLHLETDVFPPIDIIERLLSHRKKVVGALYDINFGQDRHLMIQDIEKRWAKGFTRQTYNLDFLDCLEIDGNLKQFYHIGLGCILIKSSVLKEIKFRYEKGSDSHPDSFFAFDCQKKSIPMFVDTSIMCEHKNKSWTTVINYNGALQ